MLDEPVPDVRPGFTCTADITTATRKDVVAVPIPAVAVRELVYDANGQIVKEPRDRQAPPGAGRDRRRGGGARARARRGRKRKGSFLVRDGRAEFLPIKMGIAGDKYFEVLGGLKPGDQVVTGPYNSVRSMADGDPVKVDNDKKAAGSGRYGRSARATASAERHEQVLRIGAASRSTPSGRPSCGRS